MQDKQLQSGGQERDWGPALLFSGCATLGKSLRFGQPQSLHLQTGDEVTSPS